MHGKNNILVVVLATIGCLATLTTQDYPFRNVSLPWATRVKNLVSLLTLEEIQLQMARGGHGADVSPAPPIPRLGVGPYSWNTECLRGVVGAGPATSFPQALGLAATFSPDLLFNVARATGLELRAKYNNYTRTGLYGDSRGLSCFAPVINIMRDPRWGRNQETYGEDPILTSILATRFIHGLQGNHSRYVLANSGCKHFDVHGGPENIPVSRFSFNAQVSELDWHQTFLPAFKACVDAGTYSLMCSYNSINGVPACANHKLLTEILRDTWGFTGYVISDQKALERIVDEHHYVDSYLKAAAAAVNAGVSLEISDNLPNNVMMNIVNATKTGLLNETTVRERVKPLFYTRMRLGDFDPPSMNPYTKLDVSIVQSPAHQALTLEAAIKSFVLLKNKNSFLPIKNHLKHVAVVGPMSNNKDWLYGDYPPTVNETLTITPVEGLAPLADTLSWANGCDDLHCRHYSQHYVTKAMHGADAIFVCLGTGQPVESEAHDRPDVELPGQQLQLLKDVVTYANGTPVVLLLFNAGPLNVTWADQNPSVSAIMECWFPAQSTGTALLHVLTNEGGTSSPAGRLPSTWPLLADQIPEMVNYSMSGRTYRYSNAPALYPFGFGLSYTTFRYSDIVVPKTLTPGHDLDVSVTVTNTGGYVADEVPQIYIEWVQTPVPTPRLQLVAVTRTTTVPGKPITLRFTVPAKYLAIYTDVGWIYPQCTIRVYAGGQQPNNRSVGSNVVTADVIMTKPDAPLVG
ncbi:uncharacterized protein [Littorina saxatilis]|uniref:Fibronectin type III-like domain-containing protein n=1 Tax=Littorina saxatilis TaxID=31220 RepID=A0AAN9GIG7_9CAEN